jgi:predicted permease
MPDWRLFVRTNLRLKHAPPADEADVVEDIARQLEDAYLEAVGRGLSQAEAENQARLHITDWEELARELPCNRPTTIERSFDNETRERMSMIDWAESLMRDLRFAARRLARSSGFTLVAVVTLALGIGANTVIFSAVNSILFNPVGVPDANRVLSVGVNYEKLNLRSNSASAAEFLDVSGSKDVFSAAALNVIGNYSYTGTDFPERLVGQRVTWQWFDVFGVKPMLGRVFSAEEDQPNVNRVVVLDYGTWKRLFGADPSVVGRTIELNRQPYEVIGIMGPEFRMRDVNFWTPLGLPPTALTPRARFNEFYDLVARMKPGISIQQAVAHVGLLTERVHQQNDDKGQTARNNAWSIYVRPYPEVIAGDLKSPMFVVMGVVGFVLLIACANVAGLMVARGVGRARELAVCTALGAGRWRLIRQTVTESLLIAIGGVIVAVLIAYMGIPAMLALAPPTLQGVSIELDSRVLVFTALTGIAAGVFFGLIPALQIVANKNTESLKEGGRFGTASRRQLRLRSALVVSEIALALILLVGAGLFLRSLSNLQRVDIGFDPSGVMTGMVTLPPPIYREAEKQHAFHRALLGNLAAIPGVSQAAIATPIPFAGDAGASFAIEDAPNQPGEPSPHGRLQAISAGYFAVLRIPLVSGRAFTDQDTASSEPVVIIDETLARQYWPNQDPIGKRIRRTIANASWTTIVGVARHVRHSELASDADKGVHYYPVSQTPQVFTFALLARTNLEPSTLSSAIRAAVGMVDRAQSVYDVRTMKDRVLDTLGSRRFALRLVIVFAIIAIFMAAIGLYGVISYLVAQRTHEIGIRMALGASGGQILAIVLRQGLGMTLAGIVLGWAGAFILARLVSSQLFQVPPFEPATFALMAVVVCLIAVLACLVPARRATAVEPLDACRYE